MIYLNIYGNDDRGEFEMICVYMEAIRWKEETSALEIERLALKSRQHCLSNM